MVLPSVALFHGMTDSNTDTALERNHNGMKNYYTASFLLENDVVGEEETLSNS